MAGIRVLVKFTNVLNFSKLFWHYLTNENLNLYISDLIKLLLGKLYIDDDTKNYKITLEGYEIPGDQILSILREGDKINVIPCSNYPAVNFTDCSIPFEEPNSTYTTSTISVGKSKRKKCPQKKNQHLRELACGVGATLSMIHAHAPEHQSSLIENQVEFPKESFIGHIFPDPRTENKFIEYPSLKKFPRKNYVIAFKHLELGRNYCPQLSNYKVGKVIIRNKSEKLMTIELDPSYVDHDKTPGKFDLVDDEGYKITTDSPSRLELRWLDIVEPKLISKSR